jgi:hypothetical protein
VQCLDPDPFLGVNTSVADPDPGSSAFLTPGSGMGKQSVSGSGIRNEQPGSYFVKLRNHFLGLNYLNSLIRIRDPDPRWKKFGSGMEKCRIRDPDPEKHPGSATLVNRYCAKVYI